MFKKLKAMLSKDAVAEKLTKREPVTSGYQGGFQFGYMWRHYEERPRFTLFTADQMTFDPKISLGLRLINGMLSSAEVEVKSNNAQVKEFVGQQWDRIWSTCGKVIRKTKHYGYAGFEVMYKMHHGRVEFHALLDRHPFDTRAVTSKGELRGVSIRRVKDKGMVVVWGPKALWLIHDREYGSWYGHSLLENAYAPWWEKWMQGGAVKLRQLRMIKDAWRGDVLRYPNKMVTTAEGTQVSARDIARQIGEHAQSGGTVTLPSTRDGAGNMEWDYTPPTGVAGSRDVMDYKSELDSEELEGLGVTEEVLEAAETGSGYSGRSIPLVAFLTMRDQEFGEYVTQINSQTIRPMVTLNYGSGVEYEITPKPLLDTIVAKIGSGPTGGPVGGTQQPQPGQPGQAPPAFAARQPGQPGAQQFADDPDGRWITLGGHNGEGGSHVRIGSDGRINAGAKGLEGKTLSEINKQKPMFEGIRPQPFGKKGPSNPEAHPKLFETSPQKDAKPDRKPLKGVRKLDDGRWVGAAQVNVKDLASDPSRFQYKVEGVDDTGVTKELKSVKQYNPEFGGQLLVWHDPEDGKDYVVNGHHRFELAKRSAKTEEWGGELNVHYVNAKDAQEARAKGALANIAEGRGTAVDAANFMRESGRSLDDLAESGISLSGRVARDAGPLSVLNRDLFLKLQNGMLEEGKALAIGRELTDHRQQTELFHILQKAEAKRGGRPFSNEEVQTMAAKKARAAKYTESQTDLFGKADVEQDRFVEEAELENGLRKGLNRITQALRGLTRKGAKDVIEKRGAGTVQVDEAAEQAQAASRIQMMFDKEIKYKGRLTAAIQQAAEEYANDAKRGKTKQGHIDRLIDRATEILTAALQSPDTGGAEGDSAGRGGDTGDPEAEWATRSGHSPEMKELFQFATAEEEELAQSAADKIHARGMTGAAAVAREVRRRMVALVQKKKMNP